MEKARHRRSKSATSVEGNFHVRKQKVVQNVVSDSHSYTECISKEDLLTPQLSQDSKKRGSGTPIKKLLAEEMAKEGEVKRRSLNVIARLMGLDGLPSPQHGHRQQKKSLDKHQQRNASRNIHRNNDSYEDHSSWRISVDHKDFKDVYEVLEASRVTNRRNSSKWSANSGHFKPEMEVIQQKFMDAKRLSCNAKLQVSKEFDDTLEMLDSNTDLLLRYLQKPGSLIVKPLHALQVASSKPCYDRMTSLEASNSRVKSCKCEQDNGCKYNISSRLKREDRLLLQSYSSPSKNHLDVNNEENVLPTRIVVLKPNIGKASQFVTSGSSPVSLHAHPSSYRKHLECTTTKSDVGSWKKKTSSSSVFSSRSNSREDRVIAKEITRRMRENLESFGGEFNIWTHIGAKGYAGDESSYDSYESDSSGGKTASSSNSFDWNNRYRRSSASPKNSLVSKEATERMSERWKRSRRYEDVESFGKGSTLGEMLAVPDRETRHEPLDAAMTLSGENEILHCCNNYSGSDSPLGISSRDGWKEGCAKNSSRSRSLPPSSLSSRSHRTSGRSDVLAGDLMINETINLRSTAKKGNHGNKQDYSLGDRSNWGKAHPSHHHTLSDDADSSPDVNACLIQADSSQDKLDQHEKDVLLPQMPASLGSCATSNTSAAPDVKHESLTLSLDGSLDNIRDKNNSSALQEALSYQRLPVTLSETVPSLFHCPGPEPESSESSKEADHPSPISVLEVSFKEDVSSSSDCFERVSSKLHELRMQLQLLKMESGSDTGTPLLTSNNDYVLQQSEGLLEEGCCLGGPSWESSYIDEVLSNSGIEEFDPDTFVATWYSPECPLDPWVFDNLEKNYCGETTVLLRFERKILFDRINLALLEMFKNYVDPCPWVKPKTTAFSLQGQKYGVKDALQTFLINQEMEVYGENAEMVMDREMFWPGFKDEVDIVGKEIEKILIGDLIGELLTM